MSDIRFHVSVIGGDVASVHPPGWPWPNSALHVQACEGGARFASLLVGARWLQTPGSLALGERASLPGLGCVAAYAPLAHAARPPPGGLARLWREAARLAASVFGSAVAQVDEFPGEWLAARREAEAEGGALLSQGGATFWAHGGAEPRGLFAAVRPRPPEALALALAVRAAQGLTEAPTAEALQQAADVHATLAFFGRAAAGDPRVGAVARAVGGRPWWGAGRGVGVRTLGVERVPGPEADTLQLLLDPELPRRWRDATLARLPPGLQPDRTHAFRPHVTLAKIPAGSPTPDVPAPDRVTFDSAWCCLGRRGVAFPLWSHDGARR